MKTSLSLFAFAAITAGLVACSTAPSSRTTSTTDLPSATGVGAGSVSDVTASSGPGISSGASRDLNSGSVSGATSPTYEQPAVIDDTQPRPKPASRAPGPAPGKPAH